MAHQLPITVDSVVSKIEMPISADTRVFIIFDGATPDAAAFKNFHKVVDLLEESLIKRISKKVPTIRRKSSKEYEACSLHPDAKMSSRGVCSTCHSLRLKATWAVRKASKASKENGREVQL